MRVKISKRFRMNWSGLQDFSEDLRESNKSLHFLSPRWVFNFSQRTNHLLFCVCPEYISWPSYVREWEGRLNNAIVTIAFVIVITPQDFISKNNDFNATLSFFKAIANTKKKKVRLTWAQSWFHRDLQGNVADIFFSLCNQCFFS